MRDLCYSEKPEISTNSPEELASHRFDQSLRRLAANPADETALVDARKPATRDHHRRYSEHRTDSECAIERAQETRHMARPSNRINEAIEDAVQAVIARILPTISRVVDESVEARLRAEYRPAGKDRRRARAARPTARAEITRWVADNRARRVPTFVIEATGLDTKTKIVAKYGANAAFAKGKPLPPVAFEAVKAVKLKAEAKTEREVKAKPPIVRKAAAR